MHKCDTLKGRIVEGDTSMLDDILRSIGIFLGYFLINPLLYIGLFAVYLFSGVRVKQERVSFHTRVYARIADITIPFASAILLGVYVSVLTITLGATITLPFVAVLAIIYILFAITAQVRLISPVYVLGATLLLYGLEPLLAGQALFTTLYNILGQIPIIVPALLLAIMMIAEGVLIRMNGSKYTSPRLARSKRGKWVGMHFAKRLWMVPIVLFIPEGVIPSLSFWPVFTIADMGLQPILVPFLIGFQQKVRGTLPETPIRSMGLRIVGLGILFALIAVGSYYVPVLAVVLGGLAIIAREWLYQSDKKRDAALPAYFSNQAKGCVVLGILPGSPVEKMNIAVGETIVKVNGKEVNNETSFYEALQLNSAFCKLDVLNHEGEVRFAQGALYDGEHHQLGVLLVKEDTNLQDSII
ncbi:cell division topological determinant MinJ [Halalkalibacter wakoensis JCM 9140]|uniref:Cell division topological determinant MinJ n=1 Tax=Halalkalibacter wakoensis JCM 9140 TaxID=1236970 RepID=W4Q4W5_9BACI|nr:PDZ domain-containing protein [Halalkalibacter wakoensis]GAE27131.1 cell division topological determinant MinJ [Halalkalibacter wakoensis JCM 9140]